MGRGILSNFSKDRETLFFNICFRGSPEFLLEGSAKHTLVLQYTKKLVISHENILSWLLEGFHCEKYIFEKKQIFCQLFAMLKTYIQFSEKHFFFYVKCAGCGSERSHKNRFLQHFVSVFPLDKLIFNRTDEGLSGGGRGEIGGHLIN